jgi:four helix bundle protein
MSKDENMTGRRYDLEERLMAFADRVLNVVDAIPRTRAGNHIGNQLVRCGSSPVANYGEAQSAESRSDFIHKLKLSLKELRETRIWLRLIPRRLLIKPAAKLAPLLKECDELIAIFAASTRTAEKKNARPSNGP